jgi:uncharacterized protein DUF748
MNLFTRYRAFSKWQKLIFFAVLFVILYTIFGFLILPKFVQKISVEKLSLALNRSVSINKITFNPYSLFLTIEGFDIREKNSEKTFFAFKKVMANLQTSSLFRFGPVVREVNIDGLFFNATRNKDQTYNFSDLIPDKTNAPDESLKEKDSKPEKPLRFSVSNIVLTNGIIIINDNTKDKTHRFTEMDLAIPFISNLNTHMDVFVTPHFSVNFNGSPITIKGETKPFVASQTTMMNLDLKGIDLKTYFDYLPLKTNMDLKSGTMDLYCSIEFSQHEESEALPQLFLSGQFNLFKLSVTDLKANPVFNMDELSISLGKSEVLKGFININDFIVSSPDISLSINDSNQLNLYDLLPDNDSGTKTQEEEAASKESLPIELNCKNIAIKDTLITLKDASEKKDIFSLESFTIENTKVVTKNNQVDIKKIYSNNGSLNVYRIADSRINFEGLLPLQKATDETEQDLKAVPAWNANIANIDLEGFSVKANDLVAKGRGKISIEDIALNLKSFSTLPETNAETSLKFLINKDGKVSISGKTGINPISTDLDLSVDQIHLDKFQPFVTEHLNLIISDGRFSTSGKLSVLKPKDSPLKANYQGSLNIDALKTLDSQKVKKLMEFNKLAVTGINVNSSPVSASIETLNLKKPLINIAMYQDGSLNVNKILKTKAVNEDDEEQVALKKTEKDNKENDSQIPIKIGQVILENGQVAVNDKSVNPGFKTKLTKINAKITGLSSNETIQSDINMNALVNKHTPVEIKGKINPLKTDFFCDMIVACSDMDLGYLSPYAGKYAGYKIQKGKLSLDLKYLIDKRKIDSKNEVFLDQFDFGDEVDSEDAIKAPMKLAVSLLKDPGGRISLDIPVEGDLDDPEFSVGSIIVQVIVNLLKKAATAPFSLLGAMFGGGEDLNIIAFDPGSYTITSKGAHKIETLIKALTQRPGLNLEISGFVNIEQDRTAIITKKLEQQVKEEKLKSMLKHGTKPVPIDEIILSDKEYDIFLKTVFDQTDKEKEIKEQIRQKQIDSKNEETDADKTEISENKDIEITSDQMISALKMDIQISDDDLRHLANERAIAIKGALLADENIKPERLFIVEAETLEPAESSDKSEADEKDKSKSIEKGSVIMTLK